MSHMDDNFCLTLKDTKGHSDKLIIQLSKRTAAYLFTNKITTNFNQLKNDIDIPRVISGILFSEDGNFQNLFKEIQEIPQV